MASILLLVGLVIASNSPTDNGGWTKGSCEVGNHASLLLGEWPRRRSGMSDLHEARDPGREPQIDTVGWLFLAFAVASVTAAAATVTYRANTMIANAPVSQVVAR
jgi:hypothetical protein